MALPFHPVAGTILLCDYSGFSAPEMTKVRPVVVVSPRRRNVDLCIVVALSTTPPPSVMPYHAQLQICPALPPPFDSQTCWVKGDMVLTAGFDRLTRPHKKHAGTGKREYITQQLEAEQLEIVRRCVLHATGMGHLTTALA